MTLIALIVVANLVKLLLAATVVRWARRRLQRRATGPAPSEPLSAAGLPT